KLLRIVVMLLIARYADDMADKAGCGALVHAVAGCMVVPTNEDVISPAHFGGLLRAVNLIPHAVAREIMTGVYARLRAVWRDEIEASAPGAEDTGGVAHDPFQRVGIASPSTMIATDDVEPRHSANKPLDKRPSLLGGRRLLAVKLR